MAVSPDDRLFVRDGFRHFRRTYSLSEVRWGLAILATLLAIAFWVAWSGSTPRPGLYSAGPIPGSKAPVITAGERGPLPKTIALESWADSGVSSFTAANLYEKINGRADFFLSKGFERLYTTTLSKAESPTQSIDVELYDMGSAGGAQSAFSAEKKSDVEVSEGNGNLYYDSRNATFMAQGRYYLRAIGSDESEDTRLALVRVRTTLSESLGGAERHWALALLIDELGFAAGDVANSKSMAFSIESAPESWIATHADESEWFIAELDDDAAAAEAASLFIAGFSSYGSPSNESPEWIVDEFLGRVSTARAQGKLVIGVHRANDIESGRAALAKLAAGAAKRTGAFAADDEDTASLEEL